jgi:hypothetical protein
VAVVLVNQEEQKEAYKRGGSGFSPHHSLLGVLASASCPGGSVLWVISSHSPWGGPALMVLSGRGEGRNWGAGFFCLCF